MISKIIKHASRYFSASLISAAAAFLMTKYYTSNFSPAEFGVMALYLVMFEYVVSLNSLSMNTSASRIYFDYKDNKRDEYISSIFWFMLIVSAAVMGVGMIGSSFISNWIAPETLSIYIVVILSGVFGAHLKFFSAILYNEHQSKQLFKTSLINTFSNHIISIFLISIFSFGIIGRFVGQSIGLLLNMLFVLIILHELHLFQLRRVFNKGMIKETVLLAMPGMVSMLLGLLFIYLDRIFLKHYLGDDAVGLYSLGIIIGKLMSMCFDSVSMVLFPYSIEELKKSYPEGIKKIENFSFKYYLLNICIVITLIFSVPAILYIISTGGYSEAKVVTQFIILGILMGGLYKIPAVILQYHKVVWIYPFLALFSFSINAGLNYIFIPRVGLFGAGVASFIGYFIYSYMMQLFCFKYMSKRYRLLTTVMYLFILCIFIFMYVYFT